VNRAMLFSVKQMNSFIHSLYTLGRISLAESIKCQSGQRHKKFKFCLCFCLYCYTKATLCVHCELQRYLERYLEITPVKDIVVTKTEISSTLSI